MERANQSKEDTDADAKRKVEELRLAAEKKREEQERINHTPWSEREKALLVKGLTKFPAGTHERCPDA